jgi:cell envelope-related function transcriptional attenuator common domain
LLAFRLFAVIDAYRVGGVGGSGAGGGGAHHAGSENPASAPLLRVGIAVTALTLLLVLTAAPHGIAGYYTYLSHDLLTSVFVSERDTEPSSVPGEPSTTALVPSSTSTTPMVVAITTRSATTVIPASTTTSATDAALALEPGEDRRLTLLLIGTDAGYGRKGARADSIIVGTVDLQTGFVALFGIPRNTGDLPLRGQAAKALGTKTYTGMISDLYEEAWDHPELAPEGGNPGAEVLRQAVSTLLGIPVDYYAVIDMGGFVDLVDAFGGITLNVKDRIHVRLSPPRKGEPCREYDIQPGTRHLSGHEALAFARSRKGTSDYDRMRRQRCVLKALLYQNGAAELALKFSSVVKVVRDHLGTDTPVETLPDLVKVRGRLKTDRMLTVGFMPPDYLAGRNEGRWAMESAVTIEKLSKSFGSTRALDGLDLEVRVGEVHGLLGPNGAGKTTTLRVLLGLLRADSGVARLLGGDPWRDVARLHRRLAYVPGEVSLWPNLTGGEVIDLLGRLRGGLDKKRRADLLERFELDPTKKARAYSKGNRQKVALVAALSSDVELLLLDEPTAGLDPLMDAVFRECIYELRGHGRTALLSSHILSEVEALADRVTIIREGRAVEVGSLAEMRHLARLFRSPNSPVRRTA